MKFRMKILKLYLFYYNLVKVKISKIFNMINAINKIFKIKMIFSFNFAIHLLNNDFFNTHNKLI